MNKLTKVGLSALCGSLATISSANAGDLTVTGGVDMTWASMHESQTGNPIGIGSNLTFKGSGELDNGWTFDMTVANTNASVYSAAVVDIGMGGLGNLMINQGDGNGLGAYDDKMPTAWEESWGNGLGTGVRTVGGVGSSMNIQYSTPKVLGISIVAAYAPSVGVSDTADKGYDGTSKALGKGIDAIININPSLGTEILSGLNLYVGGSHQEAQATNATYDRDVANGVAGITYDIGPISLGYAVAGELTGYEQGAGQSNTAQEAYKSSMYGVAFNVNDNLSISHSMYDTRKEGYKQSAAPVEGERFVEVVSTQIAYTMGGASIRLAEATADNMKYQTGAAYDRDATTISVSLAF
jgi:outer membrane protein OmpU